MSLFVNDVDFQLHVGDVREVLRELPAESVDCCVTSPPYWGLRDYGHDGQIGLEGTPEAYVEQLVAVFREVRRVLTPTATLWLNLGDSYAGSNRGSAISDEAFAKLQGDPSVPVGDGGKRATARQVERLPQIPQGLKPKDLIGIPWRVVFALQADGWYLRSDIIWAKPNPMPESVTDRPTKSHEYVFLLTKSPRYFFDADAVREPAEWSRWGAQTNRKHEGQGGSAGWIGDRPKGDLSQRRTAHYNTADRYGAGNGGNGGFDGLAAKMRTGEHGGRNIRSVWDIATQPYPNAHFATFPEALPERCIKAGCPEWVCATCGKPREQIWERSKFEQASISTKRQEPGMKRQDGDRNLGGQQFNKFKEANPDRHVGWSDCGHDNYRAGTVLDPFMGSGTTALVARRLGRKSIGVELNADYARLAAKRLQQLSLLAEGAA